MAITFHADLLDTTLEDFDSHFRVLLNFVGGFMHGQQGVPPIVFHDLRTEEFIEDRYNLVFPDVPYTRDKYTDYENAKRVLAEESKQYRAAVESISKALGYINVICSIRGPRITYEAVLLATVTDGEVKIDEEGKAYFMLYVARYRQHRLKLLLDEADKEKRPYAKLFYDWLEPRWGNAVKLLSIENAPPTISGAALSARDKRRYDFCKRAIRAKEDGTTFEDFIAYHAEGDDYPTTTRTLYRWMKEFGLEWK
jgi:hypothetical protein